MRANTDCECAWWTDLYDRVGEKTKVLYLITLCRDTLAKSEPLTSVSSTILLLELGSSFHTCCYYCFASVVRFRGLFSSVWR